jgi:UrcA family protein
MVNISSLLGFGLALSAAPAPHSVVVADGVPSVNVRLDDLDLSRERDVAALRARVRAAVRTVCSSRYNPGALYLETASCREDATGRADAAVRNALDKYASRGAGRVASIRVSRSF